MVICQDKAGKAGVEVDWTENDLDTLRHEAHHVVQDCIAGRPFDHRAELLFDTEEEFTEFITNGLTREEAEWVVKAYTELGVSEEQVLHELEAFATARTVNPNTISDVLLHQCSR